MNAPERKTPPLVGRALERREDVRFLTGTACYVDDLKRPRMAHAVVVRSQMAHARIKGIDTSAARALPGVLDVFTHADIQPPPQVIPLWITALPGFEHFLQVPIAADKVRYVGEPVAVVIAEDRYIAEDAADLVTIEYEPLEAVVDVEAAQARKSILHEANGTNVASHYSVGRGDVEAAFAKAAYRRKELFKIHRHSGMPLETRGLVAEWDAAEERMRVYGATKLLFRNREVLAAMLGLPETRVEMVELDVGGSFGVRGDFYPEDFLIPYAARRVGRPVKWIEDRREHLMATNHSRQMQCELEIAVDANGRILGLRGKLMVDMGAYVRPNGGVGPGKVPQFMSGPYRIDNSSYEFTALVTNKTPVGSFRGPGRYESSYFRERIIDLAAADLGMDPAELRFRNLVQPEEMPYDAGSLVPGLPATVFDKADYPLVLRRALAEFDYANARARRGRDGNGRLHGVGLGCFVESTGGGPAETARIVIAGPQRIELYTGSSSAGQGQETVMAQILADELGVPVEWIHVFHGSTTFVEKGWGTYHSRSVVMGGSAIVLAARKLRELTGGMLFAKTPIEASATYRSSNLTYTFGAQLAHVAVDPETGAVEVLRFLTVEDVGRMINPAIVHGQAIGASVQGLSATFLDQFVHDESGQLLTGSFADYLMATSTDFPNVEAISLEVSPATSNPLGAKGAGEGAIAATGAALANAVEDALRPLGVTIRELPLSPDNLKRLIRERSPREEA